MLRANKLIWISLVVVALLSGAGKAAAQEKSQPQEVPVKGMVTMVDLGAGKCIPCKMMAPILSELEKEYVNKAAIVVFDVWEDKAPARRFGIRAIPTQIFFDENGQEVFRHVGFMSREDIIAQFEAMGVRHGD